MVAAILGDDRPNRSGLEELHREREVCSRECFQGFVVEADELVLDDEPWKLESSVRVEPAVLRLGRQGEAKLVNRLTKMTHELLAFRRQKVSGCQL